jgi:uncharacterized membrane protein
MSRVDRKLLAASMLLGMGLGGFFDGILFHQILQVHGMLTAVRPKLTLVDAEVNMFWDGIFHAATWTMTVAGLALLWRSVRAGAETRTSRLGGGLLLGWGAFNAVEGVLDHYVLGLHHVVEARGLSLFDHLFVLSGVVMAIVGWRVAVHDPRGP